MGACVRIYGVLLCIYGTKERNGTMELTHNEQVAVDYAQQVGHADDVDFYRYLGRLQARGVEFEPYVPGEALARWESSK